MTATEMILTSLAAAGKKQYELAEHMGWSPQNLSSRLKKGTLTFDEVARCLSFTGYGFEIIDANGEPLAKVSNSKSPRVVRRVDNITYDTNKAQSICKNKMNGNGLFWQELFRDPTGRFFMVYYQSPAGGRDVLEPVDDATAALFQVVSSAGN